MVLSLEFDTSAGNSDIKYVRFVGVVARCKDTRVPRAKGVKKMCSVHKNEPR